MENFFTWNEQAATSFTTLTYLFQDYRSTKGRWEKTWADQVTIYTQRGGWLISIADSKKEQLGFSRKDYFYF